MGAMTLTRADVRIAWPRKAEAWPRRAALATVHVDVTADIAKERRLECVNARDAFGGVTTGVERARW